jgi:TPR repeat protein
MRAAKKGISVAQFNLALMYEYGEGVTADSGQAFFWYLKAAKKGNEAAQHNLAVLYFKGSGVERNLTLAYMWSSISVMNGNEGCSENRDAYSQLMTQQQIDEAQRMAEECVASKYTKF